MSDFKAKMHQICSPLGLRLRPCCPGELTALTRVTRPSIFKGPTSKGREGKRTRRGREGNVKGRGEEMEGRPGLAHPKILAWRPLRPKTPKSPNTALLGSY